MRSVCFIMHSDSPKLLELLHFKLLPVKFQLKKKTVTRIKKICVDYRGGFS